MVESQLGENTEVVGDLVSRANVNLHGDLKPAVLVGDIHVFGVKIVDAIETVLVLGLVGKVEADAYARVGKNAYRVGNFKSHLELQGQFKIGARKRAIDGDVGGLNEIGQATMVGELVVHAQDVEIQT